MNQYDGMTEAEIIKAEKLTPTMVNALMYRGARALRNNIIYTTTATARALFRRGILESYDDLLTNKGRDILIAIIADRNKAVEQATAEPSTETTAHSPQPATNVIRLPRQDGNWILLDSKGRTTSQAANQLMNDLDAARNELKDAKDGYAKVIQREAERVRYAKTIAESFRDFRPDTPTPELSRFAVYGAIADAGLLMNEITRLMIDIAKDDQYGYAIGESIGTLGWLYAYVLESGDVDTDGWQSRERPAVKGWDAVETYDLDADSPEWLPAWADRNNEDDLQCSARGRRLYWGEYEGCDSAVSRDEWYDKPELETRLCDSCKGDALLAERDL